MARTASGVEHIEAARKLLKSARTTDDLRLAQPVLLPLHCASSITTTKPLTAWMLCKRSINPTLSAGGELRDACVHVEQRGHMRCRATQRY